MKRAWGLLGLTIAAVLAGAAGAYWALGRATAERPARPQRYPYVFLITLDTVSARHLPLGGYDRDTMPFLSGLAEQGAWFANAATVATQSTPSHASIFTSVHPLPLGLAKNGPHLDPAWDTMASCLRRAGYRTFAVVNTHLFRSEFCSLDAGFDDYHWYHAPNDLTPPGGTNGLFGSFTRVVEDCRAHHPTRSAFFWLHTNYAHTPYDVPEAYRELFPVPGDEEAGDVNLIHLRRRRRDGQAPTRQDMEVQRARYDRALRLIDDNLRSLFDYLDRSGLRELSLVVVTADHGETFDPATSGGHSALLTRDVVDIPLLFLFPGGAHAGVRVDQLVDSRDILPTVLHALRLPVPPQAEGRSLLPMLRGRRPRKAHVAITVASPLPACTARTERWAYHEPWPAPDTPAYFDLAPRYDEPALFDLHTDPEAQVNVASAHPSVIDELARAVDRLRVAGGGDTGERLAGKALDLLAREGYFDPDHAR